MSPENSIHEIGEALIAASETREQRPSEILAELFPYVAEAGRRMSSRAIARWLHDTSGVEISYATVSRALRNPAKYWQLFAEFIEPHALRVERLTGIEADVFLADGRFLDGVEDKPVRFSGTGPAALERAHRELVEELAFLRERWFSLPDTVRDEVLSYFTTETEPNETEQ